LRVAPVSDGGFGPVGDAVSGEVEVVADAALPPRRSRTPAARRVPPACRPSGGHVTPTTRPIPRLQRIDARAEIRSSFGSTDSGSIQAGIRLFTHILSHLSSSPRRSGCGRKRGRSRSDPESLRGGGDLYRVVLFHVSEDARCGLRCRATTYALVKTVGAHQPGGADAPRVSAAITAVCSSSHAA
jgi:hypothetical protein